jgi:rubrerythrin
MPNTTLQTARLVAELNDLLQLDHDAVAAYDIAIRSLEGAAFQDALRRFKNDHERHIHELTRLIRERDAIPIQFPHLPTGVFKLAVQEAGKLGGGDVGVLLAFKANERQVRDKYRRAAESATDAEVEVVLGRGAADEARHYAWALETLDDLGTGGHTPIGRVERVVEIAHARMGDAVEAVERGAMTAAEAARRSAKDAEHPWMVAAAAIGVGFLAAALWGRE